MRASRLINILTTLQARGLVTAQSLADENEVSLRTIYRDIDDLSSSGIPVYSERGSDGGYRLLDGYRVRLNGMNAQEVDALSMAGLPKIAADLGLGSVLMAAQNKLTAALPEDLRASAARMRNRFHLDAPTWFSESDQPVYLQAIADAVWKSKRIQMRYRAWTKVKNREADPLAMVLKGGAWYLAARADDTVRTYRISRILDLVVTDIRFDRPDDFDIEDYWRKSTQRLEAEMHPVMARVRVSAFGLQILNAISAAYVRQRMVIGDIDQSGWQEVQLPVGAGSHAASEMLRLGAEVEVLEPKALRETMQNMIKTLTGLYETPASGMQAPPQKQTGIVNQMPKEL